MKKNNNKKLGHIKDKKCQQKKGSKYIIKLISKNDVILQKKNVNNKCCNLIEKNYKIKNISYYSIKIKIKNIEI